MRLFLLVFTTLFVNVSLAGEVLERVIAIVNEDIITKSDVEKFRKKLEKGGLVDDSLMRLNDTQLLLKDRKKLVEYIVDERILDSEVKKKNLTATIEQVEQEIRNITGQRNITRAQLKDALQDNGVTFAEYQDFIKTSLERHSLIEKEVRSKIKISDEDVAAAYVSKTGASLERPFEFTLKQILFRPVRGGETAALARAEKALKRLRSGELTFEKGVQRLSEDPKSADDGLLGSFLTSELPEEMRKSVANLNVGEISGIVKTKAGYHIFKVDQKKAVSDPQFEKAKGQIFGSLMMDAFRRQFRLWLDEKRRDTFIKVNEV